LPDAIQPALELAIQFDRLEVLVLSIVDHQFVTSSGEI
jgi:hypothetical protein